MSNMTMVTIFLCLMLTCINVFLAKCVILSSVVINDVILVL